jgi:hypothetical protein
MQTEERAHLTRREWRELLLWRVWQAQIALDQAMEARRKAASGCRTEGGPTREDWTNLRQALCAESDARQQYIEASTLYDGHLASRFIT